MSPRSIKNTYLQHQIIFPLILVMLGVFCLAVGSYLGIRLSREFRESPPRRVRQSDVSQIREWMTLEYIARTYGTPEHELEKSLKLKPNSYQQYSLGRIAKELNIDKDTFIEDVKVIIMEFQATHQQPPIH